jgi:Zinc binding domain
VPDCCAQELDSKNTVSLPMRASTCPVCHVMGLPLPTLTVKSLVRDHMRVDAASGYSFCRAPGCDVVYFSFVVTFYKADLKVRVGIKESADPIPLCYCFDYEMRMLKNDVRATGKSPIPDRIKSEVQSGYCACNVKNPSGRCCLGDVNRAFKLLKQEAHV